MAHEVHTTNAIVLSSVEVQDADRLFWLFTQDFGLLFASARSIREEVSKLRYSLQDLSKVRVSLVQGRGMWRITGAESVKKIQHLPLHLLPVFGRIATLVRRVTPMQGVHTEIYEVLDEVYRALEQNILPSNMLEAVSVVRILYHLGYVDVRDIPTVITSSQSYDEIHKHYTEDIHTQLVILINEGINASQL